MSLLNLTAYPATELLLLDRDGEEGTVVITKLTFKLDGQDAPQQVPVELADVHDERGALLVPSDVALERGGTSVIVSGKVLAKHASVRVGPVQRVMRAYGERRWEKQAGRWGAVETSPFVPVEARFENTFGGVSGSTRFEPNPVGCGFWTAESGIDPRDVRLPLIEDAEAPVASPESLAAPLALQPVARSWPPRLDRAGTYDESWRSERAPLVPDDFDPRAMDVAQDASVARPFLRGGEPIEIQDIGVAGLIRSSVPRVLVRASLRGRVTPPRVDILRLIPEEDRIVMTVTFIVGRPAPRASHESVILRTLRHRMRLAS